MTFEDVRKQSDLLLKRREALRIALSIYENSRTMDLTQTATDMLEQCNILTDVVKIDEAIEELKELAKNNNIKINVT